VFEPFANACKTLSFELQVTRRCEKGNMLAISGLVCDRPKMLAQRLAKTLLLLSSARFFECSCGGNSCLLRLGPALLAFSPRTLSVLQKILLKLLWQ